MLPIGDKIFDWILRRKRCPFCVAPFPVLKCVGFEAWSCPKCETDFVLDDEGDLEPFFNENYYRNQVNHFPKPETSTSPSNILCQTCTENQQKIVQLLQSFEVKDSFPFEQQRKQYELYASKLENRYPLCATCTYRVSVQLKRCEDDASLIKRRGTASSGGDWVNKLKLAEKMKWSQTFRRFIKAFFFWPDFLFQLSLVFKCILKTQTSFNDDHFYFIASVSDFKIWLPKTFEFSSLFHVLTIVLFLFQFNGIALSRSNSLEIIPQLFLVASRIITGNFLFRFDKNPVDLNMALTCTAVGLALVFRTGSRNAPIYRRLKQKSIVIYDSLTDTHTNSTNDNLFTRSNNIETLSARAPDRKSRVINAKNGFATYSQDHYKFHSFANMVGDEQSKPIMPWPEKPLPGRLNSPRLSPTFNFDENINNFSNSASAAKSLSVKLRPTKLGSFEDPLELEPMFSSFSLSDEPKRTNSTRTASEKAISEPRVNNNNSGVKKRIEMQIDPSVLGNILLTLVLVIIRVYLIRQTSLISVILAITFGLRGFVWPRLPLKAQLTSLAVALGRLIWLGAVLNDEIKEEKEEEERARVPEFISVSIVYFFHLTFYLFTCLLTLIF